MKPIISTEDKERLAAHAPEMARMLLAMISTSNRREIPRDEDVEELLRRAGAIKGA